MAAKKATYKRIVDSRGDYAGPEAGDQTSARWVKKGTKKAESGTHLSPAKEKRWNKQATEARAETVKRRSDAKKSALGTVKRAVAATQKPKSTRKGAGGKTMS